MWPASFHVHLATRSLNQGEVIAYPTESVFGLGCDPNNLTAVQRLLTIKSRSISKGLILVASDISQLDPWVDFKQVPDMQQIITTWPGHETWLVPVRADVSPLLSGQHNTLAIRVSAHPTVRKLCQYFKGAITSTSANKNGLQPARDLFSVRRSFKGDIGYYVPGQVTGNHKPSRIRNALNGQLIRG
jgi:L-threonylcarbamoyladenylate synthase